MGTQAGKPRKPRGSGKPRHIIGTPRTEARSASQSRESGVSSVSGEHGAAGLALDALPAGGVGAVAATVSGEAETSERESTSVAADQAAPSVYEQAGRFWEPLADRIRRMTVEQWAWVALLLLATVLRFWDLGQKPLHHDESEHAYYSLSFALNPSGYKYDPLLHGPFQFHAVGLMFKIVVILQNIFVLSASSSNNPWINDATARIVPALFGIGIVALPFGLRRELGRAGAWITAFLLAVSPAFVYFSRFLREDVYFNFFMFAMVVCAVQFAHKRTLRWLAGLAVASVLAYATFEGFFLTLAIFGGFLVLLAIWEVAEGVSHLLPAELSERERLIFTRIGLLAVLGGIGGIAALVGLHTLSNLGTYINAHQTQSDVQVQLLEERTVTVLIVASLVIALLVTGTLLWQIVRDDLSARAEMTGEDVELSRLERFGYAAEAVVSAPGRFFGRVRDRLDPERQSFLRGLLGISWAQWFVAGFVAWIVFIVLFTDIPGPSNPVDIGQAFQQGVGRGVWQGLYYWLQQQHVARGGQPWYYYLLLIPLYEQLAVVFGIAGAIYAVLRPTRFRLFLVVWFIGSVVIYSWAAEKMPWLTIHILLPMMLLSGILLNRIELEIVAVARRLREGGLPSLGALSWQSRVAALGAVAAVLLLIPMVHSMVELAYVNPANGPLEMMVYVQTTPDVTKAMATINRADQHVDGGQHKLRIAVGQGEEWPYWWYLRDYEQTGTATFSYAPATQNQPEDVLILLPGQDLNTFLQQHPTGYSWKEYKLRSWWDESYKPQPPAKPDPNAGLSYGVGLGRYLSYGSNPSVHATFDAGRAASRLWNWLWLRQPMGSTNGSYDFVLVVRNGIGVTP